MSLYREAGARGRGTLVGVALASIVFGGLAGFLIGSAGEDEGDDSLSAAIERAQSDVQPALSALELVTIEYGEAVQGGEVVAETEYQASLDHAERAEETLREAADDLGVLAPAETSRAQGCVESLIAELERRSEPGSVEATVARCERAIRAAARI